MDGLPRITSATLDVLRALRALGEPTWGLRIVKVTGRQTGTVYPILDRLESAGWVESSWEEDDARPGPRRRIYRFTPDGAVAAADLMTERAATGSGPARTRPLPNGEPSPT